MFVPPVFVGARSDESIVGLVLDADIIVQSVLVILVAMSIACWVIILKKFNRVRMAELQTSAFIEDFWSAQKIDDIHDRVQAYAHSPVAQVFHAGYQELGRLTHEKAQPGGELRSSTGEDNIARALRRASTEERTLLERNTTFLATTGSTAPFIGLFGTVWGILRAFQKIDTTPDSDGNITPLIDTVSGDISHALIATAIGLVAAIPAVMAYNYFNRRIRVLTTEMNNFSDDFLNIVKRHFRSR